jgi:hypothetical protein
MPYYPEKIALSAKSAQLLRRLFSDTPKLHMIYQQSATEAQAAEAIRKWAWEVIEDNADACIIL